MRYFLFSVLIFRRICAAVSVVLLPDIEYSRSIWCIFFGFLNLVIILGFSNIVRGS